MKKLTTENSANLVQIVPILQEKTQFRSFQIIILGLFPASFWSKTQATSSPLLVLGLKRTKDRWNSGRDCLCSHHVGHFGDLNHTSGHASSGKNLGWDQVVNSKGNRAQF